MCKLVDDLAIAWWRHDIMMTSSNSRYWPFVRGIHRSPVDSPHRRPVTQNSDVLFDVLEQKFEQTVDMLAIWGVMARIVTSLHCNDGNAFRIIDTLCAWFRSKMASNAEIWCILNR